MPAAFSPVAKTLTEQIVGATHGFVVGNWLYDAGTNNALASAAAAATSDVFGVVTTVIDTNTYVVTKTGLITLGSALTDGGTMFLSPTTAGAMTQTEPTTAGQVRVPLGNARSTTMINVQIGAGVVLA